MVATFPLNARNPYSQLFVSALRAAGASVIESDFRPWRSPSAPIAHVHWPESMLVGPPGKGVWHRFRLTLGAVLLVLGLVRWRLAGARIVWTAHNLGPHSPTAPVAQRWLYRWIARRADLVLAHSHYAAATVTKRFGRTGPTRVAQHGNYVGAYPEFPGTRAEARTGLGLPADIPVLLVFGQIRAYKRVLELVTEFRARPAADLILLIAGEIVEDELAVPLHGAAEADPRIFLLDGRISDADVARIFRAADLAVLNYEETFSSGALLLALSQGRAVLAPARGSATELASEPAVFAWATSPLDRVADALAVPDGLRSTASRGVADQYSWASLATATLAAYNEAIDAA